MKYFILGALGLLLLSSRLTAQSQSDLRFKKTYYIVYLGTFKTPHLFERKDLPYQLMVMMSKNGKYQYFFGKFSNEKDASFAQRLIYLSGFTSSKVKKYTKYDGQGETMVTRFS